LLQKTARIDLDVYCITYTNNAPIYKTPVSFDLNGIKVVCSFLAKCLWKNNISRKPVSFIYYKL